ncbi:MAG: alanine racemase [Nevskiaceae bacterium]|nr:MAG: alanine racemase [Nevskiaceae bacterium]TBR74106.1 MAG: alanine racemase [Nevskiaceae bacterium]
MTRALAHIDLVALRHNLARVRACAPHSRVMAAVKANAYGHGAVPVARALVAAGTEALAVACVEEALELRAAGVQVPIVLLEGVLSAAEAQIAVDEKLQIAVHSPWQMELLQGACASAPLALWGLLNTGMNRLGFAPTEAGALAAAIAQHPAWRLHGWLTHLACADDTGAAETLRQQARFDAALEGLAGERSIANSAGLMAWPSTCADWVRPGLMLYGASPVAGQTAAALDLRPVMQFESRLIAVNAVGSGARVGYGATWSAPALTYIGIVAAGYADGVPRALPSGTPVAIGSRIVPTAGRVSMDMLAVDLGPDAREQVGDTVRLWGDGVPAEAMAARVGTIAYELFCGLGPRVRRIFHGGVGDGA